MAKLEGNRIGIGGRTLPHNHIVEKIQPSAAWTDDAENHYLLIDLPGFKKEDVRLQVDDPNHIKLSGERLVKDKDKYFYFDRTFRVPENSGTNINVTCKFDGDIMCVTVPKQASNKIKEIIRPNNEDNNEQGIVNSSAPVSYNPETNFPLSGNDNNKGNNIDEFDKEKSRRCANENITPFGRAIETIKRKRCILVTALLAFAFGVVVSRGIGSSSLRQTPRRIGSEVRINHPDDLDD